MVVENALNRPIERAVSPRGRHRARIWAVQYGPCWCRAEPHTTGSFDFVRFRTTEVGPQPLHLDILVASTRVIVGSEQILRQVYDRVPDPKLVVATGHCPATRRFWNDLPAGWTPVEELIPIDLFVDECFSGHPEKLLAAVLGSGQTARTRDPEDAAARTVHS